MAIEKLDITNARVGSYAVRMKSLDSLRRTLNRKFGCGTCQVRRKQFVTITTPYGAYRYKTLSGSVGLVFCAANLMDVPVLNMLYKAGIAKITSLAVDTRQPCKA